MVVRGVRCDRVRAGKGSGGIDLRAAALLPALLAALCPWLPSPARAATAFTADNGISATIYDASEIAARWVSTQDGRTWFEHPVAGACELLTGPDDPRLPRTGVSTFVPLPAEAVAAAMRAVTGIAPLCSVEVFLLPAPPVATLGSFTRRAAIFLSPGFGPVPPETVAALTAHELGHALTWAYVDGRPDRWRQYCALRGLADETAAAELTHADRPREILAEDIRGLFGGALAGAGGAIENQALPPPQDVAGLRALLAGWLTGSPSAGLSSLLARAFPNPAPAGARIEVQIPAGTEAAAALAAGGEAAIDLYDARGRHVRRLTAGDVVNGRLTAAWDGRDQAGLRAASGCYWFSVRVAGGLARGSLQLVR